MTPRALHILRVCWGSHYKLDIIRITCSRATNADSIDSIYRIACSRATNADSIYSLLKLTCFPIDPVSLYQVKSPVCHCRLKLFAHVLHNGLPWWLSRKDSTCSAGTMDPIPGPWRSPGGGHGNPLQYSCLENPMDRGDIVLQTGVLQSIGSKRIGHAWSDLVHMHVHHNSTRVIPMQAPQTRRTFICISK